MSDANRYELRLKHCPDGCGHVVSARCVDRLPFARCPRCGGSILAKFIDNQPLRPTQRVAFYPPGIQP